MSRSWILTGSPENHGAAGDRDVTGFATAPEVVLDEPGWFPAASPVAELAGARA